MELSSLPLVSQSSPLTTNQAPFHIIPCRDLDFMLILARSLRSTFGVTTLITPSICHFLYGNSLTLSGPSPQSVCTVKHDRLNTALEGALRNLCNHVIAESLGFIGGLRFPDWAIEAEVDYYPHREHVLHETDEFGQPIPLRFGLHRDDYIPTGRDSAEGGVLFVALVYLNEAPIFGPELFVDLGPELHSTSLTVPQIRSLPAEFCRRIIAAKELELQGRSGGIHIHCPIMPPYGTVCFCEPLVLHQTPVPPEHLRTPPKLVFHSDHASARPADPSGDFDVNVTSARALSCPIVRDLERFYDQGGMEAIFERTFAQPRSLIRLTFRARRTATVVLRARGG